MNILERNRLLAEKRSLDRMLNRLPAANVIDRMSLEARMVQVEESLASLPGVSHEPARARLTFRGKPIVGSHGVFAEFGAKAIGAFVDAVAAIGASQTTSLGTRGVIPNREEFQLLITGTAVGSFGFELEEAPKDESLFPELSLLEQAIKQTYKIMEATLGTDDELTEAIEGIDPRAIDTLRSFLKTLYDQEAICALEFREAVFRFVDVGQVYRSLQRLDQDNIHEEDSTFQGCFLGVLPNKRTFEFMIVDSEDVINGKVGPDIVDADSINDILKQEVSIVVRTKRAGEGKPRYTLLTWTTDESSENQA